MRNRTAVALALALTVTPLAFQSARAQAGNGSIGPYTLAPASDPSLGTLVIASAFSAWSRVPLQFLLGRARGAAPSAYRHAIPGFALRGIGR